MPESTFCVRETEQESRSIAFVTFGGGIYSPHDSGCRILVQQQDRISRGPHAPSGLPRRRCWSTSNTAFGVDAVDPCCNNAGRSSASCEHGVPSMYRYTQQTPGRRHVHRSRSLDSVDQVSTTTQHPSPLRPRRAQPMFATRQHLMVVTETYSRVAALERLEHSFRCRSTVPNSPMTLSSTASAFAASRSLKFGRR